MFSKVEAPVSPRNNHSQDSVVNSMLLLVAFNAAIGGFLFGYDTSSISASLLQIRVPNTSDTCPGLTDHFLDNFACECITSFTILGAFVSSLFAGTINDSIGRRGVLLLASFTFAVGAIFMGIAWNLPVMLVARLIAGIGVGLCSHTMPLYVSECCPASIRGYMVVIGSVMIVLGQASAAIVSAIMFYQETPDGWRWILGIGTIPAVVMYAGLVYLPESPRWLLSQGRNSDAHMCLQKLRMGFEDSVMEQEFKEMTDGVNAELAAICVPDASESWLATVKNRYWNDLGVKRALMLGCSLQGLQQLIGINTIMYYGASVLVMASGSDPSMEDCFSESNKQSVALNILLSVGQNLGVATSLFLIENVGRRPLFLTSLLGAFVGLCGVGISFSMSQVSEAMVIVSVLIYVYMFGIGVSPVPWVFNAEIYPIHVRARCISLATSTNWFCNFIVSETFLTFANLLSTSSTAPLQHPNGVFFLYAGIAAGGFGILWYKLPETQGLTLEQATRVFVSPEEVKLLA